jgi:phospholipase/carboxylesterase
MNGIDLRPSRPGADPHAHAPVRRWGPAPGEAPSASCCSTVAATRPPASSGSRPSSPPAAPAPSPSWRPTPSAQWYPLRFLEPVERNEPWLGSALALVDRAVGALEDAGLPRERIVVAGFSQGACLALEYVARAGGAWGGAVGLSGGLIGADVDPARYPGRLDRTAVFLGCSDVDAHIPVERVHASGRQLLGQGASVVSRIYPGMAHTVNADELDWFAAHLRHLDAA